MATVNGYTAERMKEIEDTTVVGGSVSGVGNLMLTTRYGAQIDAGNVRGPQGIQGIQGIPGVNGLHGTPGGTSTQRNTLFGSPTTDAEKVALANKAVVWYNVTTGILETYFAVTGTTGLTVPGVVAPKTAGWYPLPYVDNRSLGLVHENIVASSSGGVADAIINNFATFTFKAGRKYRIVWDTSYLQSAIGDLFYWSISSAPVADAASSLSNLTVIGGRTKGILAGTSMTQHSGGLTAYYRPTSDVTTQIKFRIQRVVGGGTLTVISQGNEQAFYQIYDDGAQI